MLPHGINTLIGIWLMFAPAVIGFGGAARVQYCVIAPLIVTISYIAAWEANRPLRFANLPFCAWLVIAPVVYGYVPAAAANSVIAGLAIGALSFIEGKRRHSYAGGWGALWKK